MMDPWKPPKKWLYDLIDNAAHAAALAAMVTAFLAVILLTL